MLTFEGLGADSYYTADQFAVIISQNFFTLDGKNINDKNKFCKKLM